MRSADEYTDNDWAACFDQGKSIDEFGRLDWPSKTHKKEARGCKRRIVRFEVELEVQGKITTLQYERRTRDRMCEEELDLERLF